MNNNIQQNTSTNTVAPSPTGILTSRSGFPPQTPTTSAGTVPPSHSSSSSSSASSSLSLTTGEVKATVVDPLNVKIVDLMGVAYILNDFKEQKDVCTTWKKDLVLETHALDFVNKLLGQLDLAIKWLADSSPDAKPFPKPLTSQQKEKIVNLWQCAKRGDVKVYIKKEYAKKRLAESQGQHPAHAQVNVPIYVQTQKVEPFIKEILAVSELYFQDLFKNVSLAVQENSLEPTDGDVTMTTDEKVLTRCGDDKNYSKIKEKYNIAPASYAFISLSIITSVSPGFIHAAKIGFLTACKVQNVKYKIKNFTVNHNPYDLYLHKSMEQIYASSLPLGTVQENLLWHGTKPEIGKLIFHGGFKREYEKFAGGFPFYVNPLRALQKDSLAEQKEKTLVAVRVIQGEISTVTLEEAKTMRTPKLKPLAGKPGDEQKFSLSFFENHRDEAGEIVTANEDHQAFAALMFTVEKEEELQQEVSYSSGSSSSSNSSFSFG